MNPEVWVAFFSMNKGVDKGVEEENRYCHRANTVKIQITSMIRKKKLLEQLRDSRFQVTTAWLFGCDYST
jgi:hypothetical protein